MSICCSECTTMNSDENNYCSCCGHKLKHIPKTSNDYKEFCSHCGARVEKDDDFCNNCGCELYDDDTLLKICAVCGEKTNYNRYCTNCGHDDVKRSRLLCNYSNENLFKSFFKKDTEKKVINGDLNKKCPNCNTKHQRFFNYCEYCGTKLK